MNVPSTRVLNIGSLSVNNVTKDNIKEYLLTNIDNIWKRRMRILTDENISVLTKKCYVTLQPIGTQYYLYLTKYNDTNTSFLISKKTMKNHKYPQVLLLHMGFSDYMYQKDTLFDINLVKKNDNNYSIVITDILLNRGKRMDTDILDRYNTIMNIYEDEYVENKILQQFTVLCTPIYHHSEMESIISTKIKNIDYKINGLYIHHKNQTFVHILPRYEPRQLPASDTTDKKLEIKEPHLEQEIFNGIITLQIRTTNMPDIYHLYADNDEYVGISNIPTLKCSKLVKKLLSDCEHSYVECCFNKQFNKWEPLRYSENKIASLDLVNKNISV